MHQAIIDQKFGNFVRNFINTQFPNGTAPEWVRQALRYAEIELY
tara:strand:+ start:336 stop:467 length:132 start_codon:yes stop_codon:yes gene_type:complete